MNNSNTKELKKLDELDREILKALSKDGRLSHREIARKLGKSPVTIKKHVGELEQSGIIKNYGANINYENLGFEILAIIELSISKGKMLEVEKDIANNPHIYAVYDVTGTYDALILARFKNRRELSELVKKINSFQYVRQTNTHVILNIIKEGTDFTELIEYNEEKK